MAASILSEVDFKPLIGHCSCNTSSYTITASPLITHICYCTWCQRESGTICGSNILIESDNFKTNTVEAPGQQVPVLVAGPTPSGYGQTVARCPVCFDGLFKYYGSNRHITYVKAGTLDEESFKRVMAGDRVHIFTSSKPQWINLDQEKESGVGVFEEYYTQAEVWTKEALERRKILQKRIEEEKSTAEAGKE